MSAYRLHPALIAAIPTLAGCALGLECGTGTLESNGACIARQDSGDDGLAPVILSFATNVDTLEEGDTVTFTAVVTHPGGIEQLIGGTLQSALGATYGAFATSADEGAYTTTLSWWDLNQVNSIDLSENSDGSRPFVATFFDVEGDSASSSLEVGITCEGLAACEGRCGVACE